MVVPIAVRCPSRSFGALYAERLPRARTALLSRAGIVAVRSGFFAAVLVANRRGAVVIEAVAWPGGVEVEVGDF